MDVVGLQALMGHLSDKLDERNGVSSVMLDYYEGRHPNAWVHKKAARKYRELLAQAVTNFPLLIVDAVNDRLQVNGFRLDDQSADQMVWRELWQRNGLDIYSTLVHQQALVTGVSYVSVWPDGSGGVKVRGESSFEVFHDAEPGDPLNVRRAVKMWKDEVEGKWFAWLFLPYAIHRFEASWSEGSTRPRNWAYVDVVENPLGERIPIVPFINKPRLDGMGMSELADVLPIFDRINTLTADLLLAAEVAAFKIRWATGIEVPEDENGRPLEPFDVAMDRLWVSENENAKFGDLSGTPLEPYAKSVEQAVQQMASISRTPPYLFSGNMTNISAEALKATDSGLVKKVSHRSRVFGEAWEMVVRMGLELLGDARSSLVELECLWADPEQVSEAQRVDALVKLHGIGLPWRAVMERYGATPQEVDRWELLRSEDVFARMMLESSSRAPQLEAAPIAPVDGGGQVG